MTDTRDSLRRAAHASARLHRQVRGTWMRRWVGLLNDGVHWDGPADIGAGCRVSLSGVAGLRIGTGVAMADRARLFVRDGYLEIGAGSFIGYGALVVARERICIGPDVLIAEYVTIRDQDHTMSEPGKPRGFATAPIQIGAGAWLGAKVSVTRGVKIGAGAVIGANSVVTRDIPPGVVAVGAPARVLHSVPKEVCA